MHGVSIANGECSYGHMKIGLTSQPSVACRRRVPLAMDVAPGARVRLALRSASSAQTLDIEGILLSIVGTELLCALPSSTGAAPGLVARELVLQDGSTVSAVLSSAAPGAAAAGDQCSAASSAGRTSPAASS